MKSFRIALFFLTLLFFCSGQGLYGQGKRVLYIKPRIHAKSDKVLLRDCVTNSQILSEEEQKAEITTTPVERDETIGIVDFAYMLQRHPELMNIRLSGPRFIVLSKRVDNAAIEKAKGEVMAQIKRTDPWKNWEIDVVFSGSDETSISRAVPFERIVLLPSENRNMLGAVNMNVEFQDKYGKFLSKASLNPTILRKSMVVVMNGNAKHGQILNENNIRRMPMWLGPEGKDYISDESECVGKELARTISTGEILRPADVLSPMCARKGDMVWVECRKGSLTVKIGTLALDDGRKGDMIRVLNQPTQKTLRVKLIGDKLAEYKM